MKKKYLILNLMVITFIIIIHINAKDAQAEDYPIPKSHYLDDAEVKFKALRLCAECHTDDEGAALKPIETFSHTTDFITRHRFYASQNDNLCASCHKTSFCTECHARKDELKPNVKNPEKSEMQMPHRGSYMFQHRIDGMIDPASCFRCHGRQSNKTCKRCHK